MNRAPQATRPRPDNSNLIEDVSAFLTPFESGGGFQEWLAGGSTSAPQSSRFPDRSLAPVQHRVEELHHDINFGRLPRLQRASSSNTCASTSTVQSSVFDVASWPSTSGTRAAPTLPSRRSRLPPEIVDVLARQMPRRGEPLLPCEFGVYTSCSEVFPLSETRQWIDHILSVHLRYIPPQRCVCWYCDDYDFATDTENRETDPVTNFEHRMQHIAQHILDDGLTLGHMRPDFHFISHIYENRLISKTEYELAWSWVDGPGDEVVGLVRHDFVPPERRRQQERSQQTSHNLEAEDRDWRRAQRGSGTARLRQARK